MCEPTTVMFAMSALSAAAGYAQQDMNAKAQTKMLQQESDLQQNDLQRQRDQQREQAAGQINEAARAAQRDAATFDVITGEFGGGVTSDRARASMGIGHGEQLATIEKNASNGLHENSFAALSARSQANARLASIARPSVLGTALQIGAAAVPYADERSRIARAQRDAEFRRGLSSSGHAFDLLQSRRGSGD